jgi:hypothetical protein
MGVSDQRHAPAALCPGERTPGTHCTGGWVGPRAGLDTEDRGKILCPCRRSNPDRPDVQPVVRHYTTWATRLLYSTLSTWQILQAVWSTRWPGLRNLINLRSSFKYRSRQQTDCYIYIYNSKRKILDLWHRTDIILFITQSEYLVSARI